MTPAIEGLLFAWKKNADYGPKLVADLTEDQMVALPGPAGEAPCNHPAWVFCHLNAYLPVIEALLEGKPFEDPKEHPFGMLSQPTAVRADYPSKRELVDAFVDGHERIAALLREAPEALLEKPVTLPRWKGVMPTLGIALPYLMLNHENGHLGQLSAWRRVQGLPSV